MLYLPVVVKTLFCCSRLCCSRLWKQCSCCKVLVGLLGRLTWYLLDRRLRRLACSKFYAGYLLSCGCIVRCSGLALKFRENQDRGSPERLVVAG